MRWSNDPDAPPSSDETKAMLRSAWATDPSVVLLELASWPAMRPVRPFEGEFHANYLDATIRFLDVVEPLLDARGGRLAQQRLRLSRDAGSHCAQSRAVQCTKPRAHRGITQLRCFEGWC